MPISKFEIKDGLLTVRQSLEGGRIRVGIGGELDLSNVETVEAPLLDALASGHDVVIDLGRLEFIDSTGISLLVMVMRIKETGLSFIPCEAAEVRRLFSLTGLDERMPLAVVEPAEDLPKLPAA